MEREALYINGVQFPHCLNSERHQKRRGIRCISCFRQIWEYGGWGRWRSTERVAATVRIRVQNFTEGYIFWRSLIVLSTSCKETRVQEDSTNTHDQWGGILDTYYWEGGGEKIYLIQGL